VVGNFYLRVVKLLWLRITRNKTRFPTSTICFFQPTGQNLCLRGRALDAGSLDSGSGEIRFDDYAGSGGTYQFQFRFTIEIFH